MAPKKNSTKKGILDRLVTCREAIYFLIDNLLFKRKKVRRIEFFYLFIYFYFSHFIFSTTLFIIYLRCILLI